MAKPPTRKKNSTKKAAKKMAPTPLKQHTSFQLERGVVRDDVAKLPGPFALIKQALVVLWRHYRLFLGIVLVFALLEVALAGALIGYDKLVQTKATVATQGGDTLSRIGDSLTLFVYMFGLTSQGGNGAGGIYQVVLLIIGSLAVIWALRQAYGSGTERIVLRDAFYRSMYPLVPYVLVSAVIVLELLPMALGVGLYWAITANGLATSLPEHLLWAPLSLMLTVLSLYMIASTVFGLYIATLPDMEPMRALRSARDLVRARRFAVVWRMLLMPFGLFVVAALLVVPCLLFITPAAPWVFFLVVIFLFPVAHSYMYALYRSLL